jgi:superfamily II DNA or RNA helicase
LTGSLVEARGETWIVTRSLSFDACAVVTLEGIGANQGRRLTLIEPFDRLRPARSTRLRQRPRRRVLRTARRAIAHVRPVDGLWSAAAANIRLLPYQLEPALAVLGGATRLLLADAVGLGKTIQAGLVLAELRARGLVDRALILTPAGLRQAWAEELRERFGLSAHVLDQSAITSQSWLAAADVNPWTCREIVIASVDFVKRPEVLASVESAAFDLLIADEAHHLMPGSDRGLAAAKLARNTPWVILSSATPHSGDEAAFVFLQSIGAHDDRVAVFHRTREDAGLSRCRRTCLLPVLAAHAEIDLLDAVDRYTEAIWHTHADGSPARLVATTLKRRAASSATALLRTLTRRLSLLGQAVSLPSSQPALPWEEEDNEDADASDVLLAAPGLFDLDSERRHLEALIRLATKALASASKIDRVSRLLRRVREPALIFTEYRDTLDALAAGLSRTADVAVIHGGMPVALRRAAIDRFTRGSASVLVATDAAGEGLNLHARCRLVVNMELPWNPLRLEQRVGRVDRIGQTRRVHAIHLFHKNTIEETVLAHLERRRLRAAAALSDTAVWSSESAVAAAVFERQLPDIAPGPKLQSLRVRHAASETARLEGERLWRGASTHRRPVWSPPLDTGSSTSQLLCVVASRYFGSGGCAIEEGVEAAVIDLGSGPHDRLTWKRIVQSIAASTIAGTLHGSNSDRLAALDRALQPFRDAVLARVMSIRSDLAHQRRGEWQASLFDHRVARHEEQRLAALDGLDAHMARKVVRLAQMTSACGSVRRRLIAAWPCLDRPACRRLRL